ncbi:DUF7511 domain-containing protein [Salinirarus marinus]|uniref:DUF7511 domain-containing protein n=1 Tax=Salinirarus marinus TaxID=3068310 RepID=UPI003C6C598C
MSTEHLDGASTSASPPPREFELRSVVVDYDVGANRCTLYPADVSEEERLTHWLTADEDAFAALTEWR